MRGHPLAVREQDRATLVSWSRATTMEQRLAWRARVILALATGKAAGAVATAFHTRPSTVSKWKSRYHAQGLAGLQDAARASQWSMARRRRAGFWRSWMRRPRQAMPAGTAGCWRRPWARSAGITFGVSCARMGSA